MTTYRGEDMIGDDGYGTTEHALKSAYAALWAIANMQVQEETDKGEVLALCMSIARRELEKGDTTMKTEEQREHNQEIACLVDDIAFKASLLRIAEKALEDIRVLCVSVLIGTILTIPTAPVS